MVSIKKKKKAIQFPKFILCPEVSKCHSVLSSWLLVLPIALDWDNISIYAKTVLILVEC